MASGQPELSGLPSRSDGSPRAEACRPQDLNRHSSVLSSSNTEGEDPSVGRSRSPGSTSADDGKATPTSEEPACDSSASAQSTEEQTKVKAGAKGSGHGARFNDASSAAQVLDGAAWMEGAGDQSGEDDCSLIESDHGGENSDRGEDDMEEDEKMEEEEGTVHKALQQSECELHRSEASTRSSQAHEERLCRIVESFFPGCGIISFERLYRASQAVDEVTRESILMRDHILLPKAIASKARRVSTRMLDLWCGWAGDNGTLMQVLWMQFLRPELCCAQQRAAECKWQDALACLLALQLFLDASDDTWLTEFPVSDLDQLRRWLQVLAHLWRSILHYNDATLGLHVPTGKQGGYRRRLLQMIQQWETRCNRLMQVRFDPYTGQEEALRVRILSDMPEVGDVSALDSEWSEYGDDD